MRRLAMVLMAAVVVVIGAGQAQDQPSGGWVGQRVITQFGTVLKVGKRVVDTENLTRRARGVERRSFRIYQVERTSGARLWLVAENEDVSGWVPMAQVITLDRAIEYFTSKIRSNPENDMPYIDRGHIWDEKGDYDQAIADYTEAIRIDPRDDLGYHSRGNTWYFKGNFDKAIADYNKAIQIAPKDAWTYCDRGSTWEKKGDFDKAIADFNKAIQLDPKYADAYTACAWLWATCPDLAHRDGPRAVASATRACELTQWKDAYALGTLAAAQAEVGDFDAAVKHQEKALGRYRDKEDRQEGATRLELYRAKKPYHQEPVAR